MYENNGNILTIGFSKSLGFKPFSWIIKWYLSTPYSHTYFKFYSKTLDRNLIYESMGQGTRFIAEPNWLKNNEHVFSYSLELTTEERIEFMTYCIDNAGEEYGMLQNVGIVLSQLFKLKSNPLKSKSIYSELIAKYLMKRGFIFDKELNLITPKDIYNTLKTREECYGK